MIKIEIIEKMCNYLRVVRSAEMVYTFDFERDKIGYSKKDGKYVERDIDSVLDEMEEFGIDVYEITYSKEE